MSERIVIVDKEKIAYEGVFNAKETIATIKTWFSDKRYNPIEKRHTESIRPEGKYILLEFAPFFKFTDYAKSMLEIRVEFNEVKDVVVERDGKKQKLQEGKIFMQFTGILETDYEHRWETKPVFYFLRILFEKYVYTPFISGYERRIKEDISNLKSQIRGYLNLQQFQ
ncbi:hypothetical protein HY489_01385 [Candidatus Woesearchaeota archaeon]|nr:hypothetical protein [Candidatus Woesearchaeota archaeon]